MSKLKDTLSSFYFLLLTSMQPIHDILHQYWGYSEFRPLQQQIIESVMAGKDTLALLPTGGGKSLCYQVPAMSQEGICIVVSPLIALMKDQVEGLKQRGILAAAIYSGQSRRQIVQTLKNVAYGPYKLLYVSPERLETDLFQEFLPALNVNLLAVDEAHCISQWGYDFRPAYLRIAQLRKQLRDVPLLALTASATESVQGDICNQLGFKEPHILRQSFERKNISYSAFAVDAKINKLTQILSKVPGTTIVYCKSRKRTVEISDLLQLRGISTQPYHAGLSNEERAARQEAWIQNRTRVMVCTNAFGMGIDKPDVRAVVHYDVPDCLENYYQEAGRAGRDGNKSYAVLLYTERELQELDALPEKRYPSFTEIKTVFGALVNFLQMPTYTGEDQAFDFRFDAFVKNFKLDSLTALYALKALESDGWFDFNERSFAPATVVFTASRQLLHEFYESYPKYEPLTTMLLRTYGGIFDFPANISEALLAKLMRLKEDDVKQQLREIASLHIIQYTVANDQPKIFWRKHRVPAAELTMDHAAYRQRRESFAARVKKMLEYVHTKDCRSRFINQYFGDGAAQHCGTCDVCLQRKKTPMTPAEFDAISKHIQQQLQQPKMLSELLDAMHGTPKDKAKEVLHFLQAEAIVSGDESGKLKWK
ncbi:RecQ family ATP-dependent DNA helicase [Pseudocnuella soli]|uniref:RecQ family ATP-dependent DNA helicase n=1 Tax=Pseudocnuella soli TaxID=2502779 RepID=UPI001F02F346|nr:ATP-dependent DNA helicase RecQ [Pseudocnuella soli]